MANPTTDADRCSAQHDQLCKLAEPEHARRLWLEEMARRPRTVLEPPRGQRQQARRVAISLLTSSVDKRPIPVAEGELLVTDTERRRRTDMDRVIAGLGFRSERIRNVIRYEAVGDARFNLRHILNDLRSRNMQVSPNHVTALAPRMKGQCTPEYTDNPLAVLTPPEQASGGLVVVIDTGIDQHAAQRTDGWLQGIEPDDPSLDYDPLDLVGVDGALGADDVLDGGAGHGTFVAGIIRQVDHGARVIPLRALDTDGVGTEAGLVDAIHRAAQIFATTDPDNGGRGVLNLSLGFETADDMAPPALAEALKELPSGVIVVAAAGNSGSLRPTWPAALDSVCAVAALRRDPRNSAEMIEAEWSNHGGWVDFSTLGEGTISTFVAGTEGRAQDPVPEVFPRRDGSSQDHSYALWSGTSFAAPQVAAWLAEYLASHPDASADDAKDALRAQGKPVAAFGMGVKILDWSV